MNKVLILLRGLPGAGKSTFANYMFSNNVFEADKYFYDENGNYNFDSSKLSQAHKWCQQAFRFFREKYGDLLRYDWGEVPHFLMIQIEMTKGKTYEEAELACLRKLIEMVQNK